MLCGELLLLASVPPSLASTSKTQDGSRTVQDDWIAPAGPDHSTVLELGEEYTITCTSTLWEWFAIYAPSANVKNVDLWITGYYQHQYAHLVAESVQVNQSLASVWRVEVPPAELRATRYWVFRFLASTVTFSDGAGSISSPGFRIENTTAAASSSTSTTGPASSSTVQDSAASSTPTSSSEAAPVTVLSTGISTGSKIGIAIGAVLGAIALVILGWFLARRKKSPPQPNHLPVYSDDQRVYPEVLTTGQNERTYLPSTLSYHNIRMPRSELASNGSGKQKPPAELHG